MTIQQLLGYILVVQCNMASREFPKRITGQSPKVIKSLTYLAKLLTFVLKDGDR
jgi:hypothetical protein